MIARRCCQFGTDKAGYAADAQHVSAWPDRVWAVEGGNGAGRPLVQRLLADGEHVVDVPAKLAVRARLFDTGHNRKTDAHDAHAVAVVAVTVTSRSCSRSAAWMLITSRSLVTVAEFPWLARSLSCVGGRCLPRAV
jgi:hypothetical protein